MYNHPWRFCIRHIRVQTKLPAVRFALGIQNAGCGNRHSVPGASTGKEACALAPMSRQLLLFLIEDDSFGRGTIDSTSLWDFTPELANFARATGLNAASSLLPLTHT